jgi:O-acetyl-ADP-ribose deacetylase (regulator of RNase III)
MPNDLVVSVGSTRLHILRGNITKIAVDAIVNAANSALAGGGGVDGAIHSAGGPEIMQELDVIRANIAECPAGCAVVTGAGRLPAKYIFHAVGPIYRDGTRGEPDQLASCYRTCLDLAAQKLVKTISFPAISTGVYGYPIDAATQIALHTVAAWLEQSPAQLEEVKFVQFSERDQAVYLKEAAKYHTLGASGGYS